jgi:hypothetical protein
LQAATAWVTAAPWLSGWVSVSDELPTVIVEVFCVLVDSDFSPFDVVLSEVDAEASSEASLWSETWLDAGVRVTTAAPAPPVASMAAPIPRAALEETKESSFDGSNIGGSS